VGVKDDDLVCVFVGRLSPEKNPDVFVEAARSVIESGRANNARFFVIGDGPMRKQIEDAVNSVGSDRLTYLGYFADVSETLSGADVFVLPSSIEGFPLSLLEAMAMKLVSIASRVGAVDEVIRDGDSGYVITPGSAKEILERIILLAEDPRLVSKIGSSARIDVEKYFSARVLGENYTKLYSELKK
jgi:glycosyltransferase involved in cell wall biosynthesis